MASSYESIAQGLQEAIDLNHGRNVAAKMHRPELVDVAALRKKLGMTHMGFAAKFCISGAHWTRGDDVVAKELQAV